MATVDYIHHLAFPKLSDAEAKHLAGRATICDFKHAELVFQVGWRGLPLYVVESGAIAAVDESCDEPVTGITPTPPEFNSCSRVLDRTHKRISRTRSYANRFGRRRRDEG